MTDKDSKQTPEELTEQPLKEAATDTDEKTSSPESAESTTGDSKEAGAPEQDERMSGEDEATEPAASSESPREVPEEDSSKPAKAEQDTDTGEKKRTRKASSKKKSKSASKSSLKSTHGKVFEEKIKGAETIETLERLHTCIPGTVQFYMKGSKERFIVDGSGKEIKVIDGLVNEPDCTITIEAQDMLGIADGILNPQIAMLSEKIQVKGNSGLAMYVFNLLTL